MYLAVKTLVMKGQPLHLVEPSSDMRELSQVQTARDVYCMVSIVSSV